MPLLKVSALDRWDIAVAGRLHDADTRGLDRALPTLSRAANHGVLWMGVAAALWASGRPAERRAALRGLGGLAIASAVSNGPAKWLARRPRPLLDAVPVARRLVRAPVTTSFPSGHSASAAAFATGVALERPALAVPIAVLAGGVAVSRVHTGVHYPSDVLAGLAVGALASYSLTRVWPVRAPAEPAERNAAAQVPQAGDGSGLVVVVNSAAGADGPGEVEAEVLERFPAADVRILSPDADLAAELAKAATDARILGVAGGDGSINAAARVALAADLPLLVIPGGTLNHFAAELGLLSVADALDAVGAGTAGFVDVGWVDASSSGDSDAAIFLNNASIGSYPEMVAARERLEHRLGKWPAMLVALVRILRHSEPVEVDVDGVRRRLWLLFAGNCIYSPRGFAPSWRDRLDDGLLDLRLLDATRPYSRSRLVAAVLGGQLARSPVFETRAAQRVEIVAAEEPVRLARDGEVDEPRAVLTLAKAGPLRVYRAAD